MNFHAEKVHSPNAPAGTWIVKSDDGIEQTVQVQQHPGQSAEDERDTAIRIAQERWAEVKRSGMNPKQRERYRLCIAAYEAGVKGCHIGTDDDWWPELGPLTSAEREAVKRGMRQQGRHGVVGLR